MKAPQSWEGLKCNFCQEMICPICTDIYDVPHLCEECSAAFHNCCVINHVINHNIGISHIFRYPSCDILLKIDEDEIIEVSAEAMDDPELISVKDYLEKEKLEFSPKIMEFKELEKPEQAHREIQNEESKEFQEKQVLIGGYFGKVFTVKKVGDKLVYEKTSMRTLTKGENNNQKLKEPKYWKPSNDNIPKKKGIKICPLCGNSMERNVKRCQKCGHDFLE